MQREGIIMDYKKYIAEKIKVEGVTEEEIMLLIKNLKEESGND